MEEYFTDLFIKSEDDLMRYITKIQSMIRKSFEYKHYIGYLHEIHDMRTCSELSNYNYENSNVTLEFHHHPITLFEIVQIIGKKYLDDNKEKNILSFDIANEVIRSHLNDEIPGIMLSKTFHQLYHSGQYIIKNSDELNSGKSNIFLKKYKKYMTEKQIKKYNEYIDKEDINEEKK